MLTMDHLIWTYDWPWRFTARSTDGVSFEFARDPRQQAAASPSRATFRDAKIQLNIWHVAKYSGWDWLGLLEGIKTVAKQIFSWCLDNVPQTALHCTQALLASHSLQSTGAQSAHSGGGAGLGRPHCSLGRGLGFTFFRKLSTIGWRHWPMESSPCAGDLCRPPPLPPTMGPAHQQQCKFSPACWRWRCGGRGTVGPGRAGGGPGGPQQRARRSSQRANMRIVSLCGAGLGWAGLGWAGAAPGPGTRHQLQSGSRRQGASTERRLETRCHLVTSVHTTPGTTAQSRITSDQASMP